MKRRESDVPERINDVRLGSDPDGIPASHPFAVVPATDIDLRRRSTRNPSSHAPWISRDIAALRVVRPSVRMRAYAADDAARTSGAEPLLQQPHSLP
jgi:hypothetical protein